MDKELIFKTNNFFQSVSFDKDTLSWYFVFGDRTAFNVSSFWRLLKEKQIALVSLDNGHQFGLPKPVDLIEELDNRLAGQSLLEIKIKADTADLLLTLTNNIQIEIYISSTGYESYNFTHNDKTYIGLGSGDVSVY